MEMFSNMWIKYVLVAACIGAEAGIGEANRVIKINLDDQTKVNYNYTLRVPNWGPNTQRPFMLEIKDETVRSHLDCECNFTPHQFTAGRSYEGCSIKGIVNKEHSKTYVCTLSEEGKTRKIYVNIELIVLDRTEIVELTNITKTVPRPPTKLIEGNAGISLTYFWAYDHDVIKGFKCTGETINGYKYEKGTAFTTEISEDKVEATLKVPRVSPAMSGNITCVVIRENDVTFTHIIRFTVAPSPLKASATVVPGVRNDISCSTNGGFNDISTCVWHMFDETNKEIGRSTNQTISKDRSKCYFAENITDHNITKLQCNISVHGQEETPVIYNIEFKSAFSTIDASARSKRQSPDEIGIDNSPAAEYKKGNDNSTAAEYKKDKFGGLTVMAWVGIGVAVCVVTIVSIVGAVFYAKHKMASTLAINSSQAPQNPINKNSRPEISETARYSAEPKRSAHAIAAGTGQAASKSQAFTCPVAVVAPLPGRKKKEKKDNEKAKLKREMEQRPPIPIPIDSDEEGDYDDDEEEDDEEDAYWEIGPLGTVKSKKDKPEPPPHATQSLTRKLKPAVPPMPNKMQKTNLKWNTLEPKKSKPPTTAKPRSETMQSNWKRPQNKVHEPKLVPIPSPKPLNPSSRIGKKDTVEEIAALRPPMLPNFLQELNQKLPTTPKLGGKQHMMPQPTRLPSNNATGEDKTSYETIESLESDEDSNQRFMRIAGKPPPPNPKPTKPSAVGNQITLIVPAANPGKLQKGQLFGRKQSQETPARAQMLQSSTKPGRHYDNIAPAVKAQHFKSRKDEVDKGTAHKAFPPNFGPDVLIGERPKKTFATGAKTPMMDIKSSIAASALPPRLRSDVDEDAQSYKSIDTVSSDEDYRLELPNKNAHEGELSSGEEWNDYDEINPIPPPVRRSSLHAERQDRPESEHIYEDPTKFDLHKNTSGNRSEKANFGKPMVPNFLQELNSKLPNPSKVKEKPLPPLPQPPPEEEYGNMEAIRKQISRKY